MNYNLQISYFEREKTTKINSKFLVTSTNCQSKKPSFNIEPGQKVTQISCSSLSCATFTMKSSCKRSPSFFCFFVSMVHQTNLIPVHLLMLSTHLYRHCFLAFFPLGFQFILRNISKIYITYPWARLKNSKVFYGKTGEAGQESLGPKRSRKHLQQHLYSLSNQYTKHE